MRNGFRLLGAAVVILLCLPGYARAETDEPIETDRPDVTNSSRVVPRGVFQIETGIERETLRQNGQRERSWFTPALFRWGSADRWEARLETFGYSRTRSSSAAGVERTSGYSPVEFGARYQFQEPPEGSRRPSLGAMFQVQVPSGSSQFSTARVTGSLRLAADWELSPKWSLAANLGVGIAEKETGRTFAYGLATGSISYAVTERLRTFAELADQGAETGSGGKGLLVDGGFLYRVGKDTQLDLGIGTNLTGRTTPDLFWTLGLSHRLR